MIEKKERYGYTLKISIAFLLASINMLSWSCSIPRLPSPSDSNVKEIGEVPYLHNPSAPQFINTEKQWEVVQRDSTNNQVIYRVVHIYASDSTYIDAIPIHKTFAVEIPYLQGEYPKILEDIIIKPNPANNFVDILFNPAASYYVNIHLGNTFGKVIYNYIMHVEKGSDSKHRIDVSNYPTGIYFIKFDAEGLTSTKELIITK